MERQILFTSLNLWRVDAWRGRRRGRRGMRAVRAMRARISDMRMTQRWRLYFPDDLLHYKSGGACRLYALRYINSSDFILMSYKTSDDVYNCCDVSLNTPCLFLVITVREGYFITYRSMLWTVVTYVAR